MKLKSHLTKLPLPLLVTLGAIAASPAQAEVQEAWVWQDYNPYDGSYEPDFYWTAIWNDDNISYRGEWYFGSMEEYFYARDIDIYRSL